jgi:sphingolipid 4-desaturase/C4-monooxygenase
MTGRRDVSSQALGTAAPRGGGVTSAVEASVAGTRFVADGRFHHQRRAAILRHHPEIKRLFGTSARTAIVATGVVVSQFGIAAALSGQAWWIILIMAYAIGAFMAHGLNVVIHECSHNLVARSTWLNKSVAIFANLPALVPSALAFRHYHLLHHRFVGQRGLDADVAMPWEVRLIGHSPITKFLWIVAQPFSYSLWHPLQVQKRIPFDRWLIANAILVSGAAVVVALTLGISSFLYLALSTYFAVGPHATGAHILQEHFIFEGREETTSYYGLINLISINHGMHLEHHDFPNIPGWRLVKLRRAASEYYDNRFHHHSRLITMWRFVMDRRIALDSRAIHAGN